MKKLIKIAVKTGMTLKLDEMHDFQGDLKELTEERYEQLKAEIAETGFGFAPHVWKNPKDNKWYKVDGHQRTKTIRRMIDEEGYTLEGDIPVAETVAKTFKEAKRRVLQAVSQYGRVTLQGLHEFSRDAGIDVQDIQASFDIPHVDMQDLMTTFVEPIVVGDEKPVTVDPHNRAAPGSKQKEKNSEITADDFDDLKHKCPRCNFEFGDDK